MKNLKISEIIEKKYSSSVTVHKPKKGTFSDITAVNYNLIKGETYSASIKIIQKDNHSFEQEVFI